MWQWGRGDSSQSECGDTWWSIRGSWEEEVVCGWGVLSTGRGVIVWVQWDSGWEVWVVEEEEGEVCNH